MKRTPVLILVASLMGVLMIAGCDKKTPPKDNFGSPRLSTFPAQKAGGAAIPPRDIPKADVSVPLGNYVKLESGNQLMFMYYALSGVPADYDKITELYSVDYRRATDGFKRQDIMKALRPRIDAEIEKAKNNRYFVYTVTGRGSLVLGTYNFGLKSFPLNQNIWSADALSYFPDNPSHGLSFTNGEKFKALHVEDQDAARKIEAMASGFKEFKVTIYAFAQDADPSNGRINAQIVKMRIADEKGNNLSGRE